tara:strand:- start:26960 stop:27700 length:741 start_codon:yes stop_codon:yes gene_type:complete
MIQKHLRNKDLIPQNKLDDITVVGLGGIGSSVVMLLAIMGFKNIRGYDNDVMQEHNFGTTLYPESWYDKNEENSKSSMAETIIKNYGGENVNSEMLYQEFTGVGQVLSPKTIVCTDNMNSRKLVYESWLNYSNREVFIDLRMDALTMSCITTTEKSDDYMSHWFPPGGSGSEAPCTMKHTIFCANLISGLGVNQLFNYLTGRPFYQYIWQGLSPLDMKVEDFNSGEEINTKTNIKSEEKLYGYTSP